MAGKFITLEGGEGSGKSTQCRRLAEWLQSLGITAYVTREPGGTMTAEAIRRILLDPMHDMGPVSELLLFLAARKHHVDAIIKPHLAEGTWVICDRYQDSTTVYQGVGRGLGIDYCESLYEQVLPDFWPDVTLMMQLPAEEGMARAKARGGGADRFEKEALEFHNKLSAGFEILLARHPQRCVSVDAAGSEEEVSERIQSLLAARYPELQAANVEAV